MLIVAGDCAVSLIVTVIEFTIEGGYAVERPWVLQCFRTPNSVILMYTYTLMYGEILVNED